MKEGVLVINYFAHCIDVERINQGASEKIIGS